MGLLGADRHDGFVAERVQTGEPFADSRQLRLYQESLVTVAKGHPGVTAFVGTFFAGHEAGAITETDELPPGPQREVLAIALAGLFELLGRHPVVFHAELNAVRNEPASCQKSTDLAEILADHLQGLADEGAQRDGAQCTMPLLARAPDALAVDVVEPWQDLGDHRQKIVLKETDL